VRSGSFAAQCLNARSFLRPDEAKAVFRCEALSFAREGEAPPCPSVFAGSAVRIRASASSDRAKSDPSAEAGPLGSASTSGSSRGSDRFFRVDVLWPHLVEHGRVGAQRDLRTVAHLTRYFDHRLTGVDQKRSERVPQVVRPRALKPNVLSRRLEDSPPPVLPIEIRPGGAIRLREQERIEFRRSGSLVPRLKSSETGRWSAVL
jgi:hypothetical protein